MEKKESIISTMKIEHYPSKKDIYYCVGSKEKAKVFEEDGAVHLAWDKVPEADLLEKITALRLLPNKGQVGKAKFPAFVKELKRLSIIEIPVPFLSILKKGDLPKGLKTIMISNRKDYADLVTKQVPEWPDVVLPSLKALIFFNEMGCVELTSMLNISQQHVPALEYLSIRVDKKGKILQDLEKFTSLRHLELEFASKYDVFSHISSPLEALAIIAADKELPVGDLMKFPQLKTIFWNTIRAEIDCNVFTQLPDLLELEIINSKKIEHAEALLLCKKLKNIIFVNCNDPFKKIKKEFAAENYNILDIMYA